MNITDPKLFDEIDCLTFGVFKDFPELAHGVFTRQGGVSLPPYNTLNVGRSVGDEPSYVVENRERIYAYLMHKKALAAGEKRGFHGEKREMSQHCPHALFINQIHGDTLTIITRDVGDDLFLISDGKGRRLDLHSDQFRRPEQDWRDGTGVCLPEADAIITNAKGLLTVIQVADCQGVILYDPVKQVLANVHSGWRGSVLNILGKSVQAMVEKFDVHPKDIRAAISPSLGPCCAEFRNYRQELPHHLWRYRKDASVFGKENHFDFWKMSFDQLIAQGIPSDHVEISGICTACHTDRFYSYRKEKKTGRFAVVAAIFADDSTDL